MECCSTCDSPFTGELHGRVPLQWEQAVAPNPRCFSCFRKQYSNVLYFLCSTTFPALSGVPCAQGAGSEKAYYRDVDLDSHFKPLVQKELLTRGYKEDIVQVVHARMASDFKSHIGLGIEAFVNAMIPFYWCAYVASPPP